MVAANGENPELEHGLHRAPHVGALVDDVARLVQSIVSADESEGVDDAFEFVGAPMHITDI